MEKLSQAEFDENVIEEEQHCIVLFSRKDCHVCQAVHPMLEDLESDYGSIPLKKNQPCFRNMAARVSLR